MSSLSASGPAAVDYSHGQLTVVSERATLGQVLKLVAAKTGGMIDVAPELQNEPVMARLGPGPVREVLTGIKRAGADLIITYHGLMAVRAIMAGTWD